MKAQVGAVVAMMQLLALKMAGAHKPTNEGASRSWKKQTDIPLQNLQKGAQPNWHLD